MLNTIQIGDLDETEFVTTDTHIIFYKVMQDMDGCDPMDNSGSGEIVSFGRRHNNYQDPEDFVNEEGTFIMPENSVPLSAYEHGNILWFVQNDATPPGVEFQWDGVRFAGLWIADDEVMDNINYNGILEGEALQNALREYAAGVVKEYSDWCNGEVYGYSISKYALMKDAEGDIIEDEDEYLELGAIDEANDSCWGYIGYDSLETELQNIVTFYMKNNS